MALKVAGGTHVVLHCKIGSIRAQGLFDFGPRPDIELALLALRIGVERGGKGPLRRGHFAGEPFHGLARALAEKLLAAALIGQRQQLQELCVVVKHLLEMRHQPALVHRVARKAAAEVIVNAALTHAIQRMLDRLEKARIAGACAGPPKHLQNRRLRKLGRAAQAAIDRIEHIADLLRGGVELAHTDGDFVRRARLIGEPCQQRRAVLLDLFRLLAEQPRHLAQNIGESRPPVALLLGKISSAPHRLRLRREKHGQRPAALLAQQMQRVHVDLVDVRPLLAVDLDVDEQLVHHGGCAFVLERLVRHHVAPVAGGVADREQDRPIAALGLGQGLRPPLPPVHRIVLVLQQIGRGRGGQAIFVRGVLRRGHRRSLARITRQTNWPSV